MSIWPSSKTAPKLVIGTLAHGFPLWPSKVYLNAPQLATHKHLIGVSGVGKSKLLESLFLQLHRQGVGVSFIDPHADSAEALLGSLHAERYFDRPDAQERLLYVEFSESGPYLPFNVLNQPAASPHSLAANVLESFHRSWPALGEGAAPQFDNLVLAGSLVLTENQLSLPALHRLLTDKPFRDGLLQHVRDDDTVAFFRDRFERWSKNEAPQMVESTLRRLFLLTFSPVLKYSLGQTENALDFRQILDGGHSVIYNLGRVQDPDARRLLGCLLTIGYETAALARGPSEARTQHHLLLDEFSEYSAQSEEALSRMLSATRKHGLFATMAHQTWTQASARLQGALQNVGVKIAMRVGRADGEILAKMFGVVDPFQVKSEPLREKTQPVFMELPSQWEGWIQTLVDMPARQGLVKVGNMRTVQIRTLPVPEPKVSRQAVEQVKAAYRNRLMKRQEDICFSYQERRSAPRSRRWVEE